MVMSPAGLGPENNCAGEGQQELQTTDPSERLLRKEYDRKCLVEKILIVSLKGLVAKKK
jgi:hypothetical protein